MHKITYNTNQCYIGSCTDEPISPEHWGYMIPIFFPVVASNFLVCVPYWKFLGVIISTLDPTKVGHKQKNAKNNPSSISYLTITPVFYPLFFGVIGKSMSNSFGDQNIFFETELLLGQMLSWICPSFGLSELGWNFLKCEKCVLSQTTYHRDLYF